MFLDLGTPGAEGNVFPKTILSGQNNRLFHCQLCACYQVFLFITYVEEHDEVLLTKVIFEDDHILSLVQKKEFHNH